MKIYYFIILFITFFFNLVAQPDPVKTYSAKDIEGRQWFGKANFYSDVVIFIKKSLPSDGIPEVRFTKSGKVIFCENIIERRLQVNASGQEYFVEPGRYCDSIVTKFQVIKNIIHVTQAEVYHYYFKIEIGTNGNLELKVTDPKNFYKN